MRTILRTQLSIDSQKYSPNLKNFMIGHPLDATNTQGPAKNGPWMVNIKPLVVQIEAKPRKIPIWVNLCNLPTEAWIGKRINVLASRIDKPLLMDTMTTSMCTSGYGRVGYARVLLGIEAKKGLVDTIEV
ncbi:RNA-directed DNA polymerase, eukaryota, reverse transcriptase zinc-binding domain protein [Tanacetum coccineum]